MRPIISFTFTGLETGSDFAMAVTKADKSDGRGRKNRPIPEHHAYLLRIKFHPSMNVHNHERNVIRGRALPPSVDGIKNALFHFLGRQQRQSPDNFLESGDAEHFSP